MIVRRIIAVACAAAAAAAAQAAPLSADRDAERAQAAIDRDPEKRQLIANVLHRGGLDILKFPSGPKGAIHETVLVTGSGKPFTDCEAVDACPEMVVVPATAQAGFTIGSPPEEPGRLPSEEQSKVAVKAFAIGKYEISKKQYFACVTAGACKPPEWLEPGGEHNIETGKGVTYKSLGASITGDDQPIVGVSWDDAHAYTDWLSQKTGQTYRLPSEAEWEYAARAGTSTAYWWGNDVRAESKVMANCRGCGSERDGTGFYPVTSFDPNPWGLHNVHGNVWEWVADFYCESYKTGPGDGSARMSKACTDGTSPEGLRVFRGGSSFYEPRQMRAAMRLRNWPHFRNQTLGFRVARDIALDRTISPDPGGEK